VTRARIAGAALLVVLGVGVLTRITDHRESAKSPASVPVEIRTIEGQPVTESVDLRNGNLHMEIPIRAARQKSTAPSSAHRTE
jgi:hypothetical protein